MSTITERTEMRFSTDLAARAGRWCARHRRTAILVWIAVGVVAFMAGGRNGWLPGRPGRAGAAEVQPAQA